MGTTPQIGLEQARATLPALVDEASAGRGSVITRHGKPVAAVVPVSAWLNARKAAGFLALRGTGSGLWKEGAARAVGRLRDEWR